MKKILYTVLGLILAASTFAWLDTPQRAEAAIDAQLVGYTANGNSCNGTGNIPLGQPASALDWDIVVNLTAPDAYPIQVRVDRTSANGTFVGTPFAVNSNAVVNGASSGNGGLSPVPADSFFTFNFTLHATNTVFATVTFNCTTGGSEAGASPLAVTDPTGDADGDNVRNGQDNCVLVANADQANDWGSSQGDACDTSFFDNGRGVKAFQRRNGNFNIFACTGGDCVFVGEIITSTLGSGQQTFQGSDARGWSVVVGLLSDSGTERIYQVFTFDPNGNIVDDTFFIIIGPDYINWRGSSTSGGLKLSEVVALVGGSSNGGSTSALIPAGFEVYIPNARINPPGFTANPSVRPGDQAVAIGSVNIRIAPDLKADQTGVQVPYGAIVTVIEEGGGGYWFYVVGDGFEGWVVNEWFAPIN